MTTTADLIASAQRGNVNAFNELVLQHQELAYNVALRLLDDSALAADTVQESVISAFHALPRFVGDNFRAWFLRIVHNKSLDYLRARQRHPETSLEGMTEEYESNPALPAEMDTPEDSAERAELFHAIQHCLNQLNEAYRSTVILCDMEGFEYEEIAEILQISLGTVKSRLNRGRNKLQGCLHTFLELLPTKYRLGMSDK